MTRSIKADWEKEWDANPLARRHPKDFIRQTLSEERKKIINLIIDQTKYETSSMELLPFLAQLKGDKTK